jgi:hypothetical protein
MHIIYRGAGNDISFKQLSFSLHQLTISLPHSKQLRMGVPFSSEVKTAVDLATELAADLKSHATTALYALVFIAVIHTFLLGVFLIAIIGLLITVNPDLVEERKAFVTPGVKLLLMPLRGWKRLSTRQAQADSRQSPRMFRSEDSVHENEGPRRRR